ncbi:MAG: NAD(P)/FAD-dependent oxidoreductase [Acidimicrobiales bacterium]
MSPGSKTVVVAGAGLAGLRACEGLRSGGFEGRLVLLGDEPHLPYDRPPLSKQFLAGDWPADRLLLRPEASFAELGVELLLELRASELDVERGRLGCAGGQEVAFDGLVIATGAAPRLLPGLSELGQAHVLRTYEDAVRLKAALAIGEDGVTSDARLLLVGAGFIGLEVAATARRFGVEVDVVDPLAGPLGRVLPGEVGAVVEAIHRDHGVRLHLSATLAAVEDLGKGAGLACRLSDGSAMEVDAVLVGIGAAPAVSWLETSGLDVSPDGLGCDAWLRVAPRIVAAGDVARFPFGARAGQGPGGTVRLEHRTSAAELGEHAARSLLAELHGLEPSGGSPSSQAGPAPFETVPYVWSDQYDVKIQVLGLPGPSDQVVVVDGSLESRRFVACLGRDGVLAAAVSFGRPRPLMKLRPLLARGASFAEALALDLS